LPKGGRGDLFAKLQIVTPQDLNEIEQECYEKIQANTSFDPRIHLEEIKLLEFRLKKKKRQSKRDTNCLK
jgi:curved DNA-binding protein